MPLTNAQKANVRRHLRYPVIGLFKAGPAGATFGSGAAGWRFFQSWGHLEYKMNNLNPDEEARLLGSTYGSILLIGPQPNTGDQISITLSGGPILTPQVLTATAPAATASVPDTRISLVNLIAAACANNGTLQTAGVLSLSPYGTGPFAQNAAAIAECAFVCAQAFTLSNASGTGILVPQIANQPAVLGPSASLDGITTINGYLPILDGLEAAYAGTSQNLDTIKADVWTARSNEAGQRRSMYENWVQMLSDYLGIPVCNFARARPSMTGALRYA